MIPKSDVSKILFLDRDGVINKGIVNNYVTRWEEFEFLPGVKEALGALCGIGYSVIVITNQQCIGKKIITESELQMIHEKMTLELVSSGVSVLDIFVCPHLRSDNCICRKPKPGMLLQAKDKYDIDLSKAIFIGDSASDIEAGRSAGTITFLISNSGKLAEIDHPARPDKIFGSLAEAADYLLKGSG